MLALVRKPTHPASAIVKNGSTGSAIVTPVAARNRDPRRVLSGKESSRLLAEFQLLDKCLEEILLLPDVHRVFGDLLEIGLVPAFPERFIDRLHIAHLAKENDLASQLASVLFEILFLLRIDPDRGPADGPMARRRPGQRLGDEHRGVRLRHARPRVQLPPAHAKLTPVLKMGITASHGRELVARPLVGTLQIRRAGQPRPDPIH